MPSKSTPTLKEIPLDSNVKVRYLTPVIDVNLREVVRTISKHAVWIELSQAQPDGGRKIFVMPCANTPVFVDDVCTLLLDIHPDAHYTACYMDLAGNNRSWEIRSRGDFDCESIAKHYGGRGGRSSGFFITSKDFLPLV